MAFRFRHSQSLLRRRQRLSPEGLRVEGFVAPPRSPGLPETATRCWRDFRAAFETCAAA